MIPFHGARFHTHPIMIRILFRSAVAALLAFAAVGAQDRTVSARLVYFEPAAGDPVELHCAGKDNAFIKCMPGSSISAEPVSCPVDASGKVVFTRTQARDQIVATATIPAGVDRAILFLLRNPQSAGTKAAPYRVLTVDESKSALPPGGSYVCNLTAKNARITVGEHKYQLVPGKPALIQRPDRRDAYNMATFLLEAQDADAWSPLKDTTMRFSESERYFVLVHPAGQRAAVKIYKQVVAADVPPPADAPGAAEP